jgi:hypothetical protein
MAAVRTFLVNPLMTLMDLETLLSPVPPRKHTCISIAGRSTYTYTYTCLCFFCSTPHFWGIVWGRRWKFQTRRS